LHAQTGDDERTCGSAAYCNAKCTTRNALLLYLLVIRMSSSVNEVTCSSTSLHSKDGVVVHVAERNPTSRSLWSGISTAITESWHVLQNRDNRPMRQCAAIVLMGFMAFLVEGIIAVILHDRTTMIISVVFDTALLFLMTDFSTMRWLICRK
jgi:hypothetical protein